MKEAQDLSGQRFGHLVVLEFDHKDTKSRKRFWKCKCDCGKNCIVYQNHLKSGHTKSCGCLHSTKNINVTHGCCRRTVPKKRIYKIWIGMKNRCFNKNNQAYNKYGGRGITVCEEWLDFSKFKEWSFKHGYSDNLTIDRIDVNGNYCPENCRWVNEIIQANNRRSSIYLTVDNETHTISEWTKIYNLPRGLISSRINKLGWDIKKAITTPLKRKD